MATVGTGAFTYSEWGLRHDPDGKISALIDLLSQFNGMMDDQMTMECQSGNAFEFTQVTKLPVATRRIYNQGVAATQAGVAKQVTTCAEYGDWVKFDASLAELGGNLAELRAQEDLLHIEALGQLTASDFFYGSRANDPTQFTGLANIFNTTNTANSPVAKNVIDCLGTGSDNASMWLVTWGPKKIHTLFPKGTTAGLIHKDFGLLPASDSNNLEFPAYRTWLNQKLGLAVPDWRYVVRACNIDVSDLDTASPANLINTLIKMVHKTPTAPVGVAPIQDSDAIEQLVPGRSAIYMDRTLLTFLDLQAVNKTNMLLKQEQWGGATVTTFRGIPLRGCDALLNSEARVVSTPAQQGGAFGNTTFSGAPGATTADPTT
jgi:hypothetical protein